ncbi:MAG: endolytic transglycosylase MltG [Pseudomonadota bacterium]|nr:endolytic transglycosylase MltG [Pseudomonadota bacterium]
MHKLRIFLSILFLLLIIFISFFLYFLQSLNSSVGHIAQDTKFIINPGQSLGEISDQLQDLGIISSAQYFKFYAVITRKDQSLKAGEYLFEPNEKIVTVLNKIVNNDTYERYLTIPEGLTSIQILNLINNAEGMNDAQLETLDEGSILPETYNYSWGGDRKELLHRMKKSLEDFVEKAWLLRKDNLPFSSINEALILASIVEKETSLERERSKVASVFVNRLRKGMRLQSDPTVIYGIDKNGFLGRKITRSDLNGYTEFNTYKISGLPPNPICHAGKSSIMAVLNPEETDYLYFVADGLGGHVFAKTLRAHNKNVSKWRRLENK